jgi:hypothetical protein
MHDYAEWLSHAWHATPDGHRNLRPPMGYRMSNLLTTVPEVISGSYHERFQRSNTTER